ncbi:MAG TPA: DUF3696 domain-containing protein [Acidobacteriota bacterium]|nr:DUF3696 domain-containing protein [Acidobacteriota bacterium]
MLKSIKISNFKAFGPEQTIPIKPLTLIYGANSSGKSSILQSIQFLEAAFKDDYNIALESDKYDTIDIPHVDVSDFVYKKKEGGTVSIAVTYDGDSDIAKLVGNKVKSVTIKIIAGTYKEHYVEEGFDDDNLDIHIKDKEKERSRVVILKIIISVNYKDIIEIHYTDGEYKIEFFHSSFISQYLTTRKLRKKGLLINNNDLMKQINEHIACLRFNNKFYKYFEDCHNMCTPSKIHKDPDIQNILMEEISQFVVKIAGKCFNRYYHIGPVRSIEQRSTVISNKIDFKDLKDWNRGSLIGRGINMDELLANEKLIIKINKWFKRCKIEYAIAKRIQPYNAYSYNIIPELKNNKLDIAHKYEHVGSGISQMLPILANAFGNNKMHIAIEQPELHLHPALQCELADVFIESALGKNKNAFLLETHSEHLLLRIMRRMRETAKGNHPPGDPLRLTPEDVAVLYVEPDDDTSIVREMPLNKYGELVKPWPGGFFEEGLREIF